MDLYDIEKDKWYFQSTSSESTFPIKTLSGCAAVGSSGRTWEIYMHGGSFDPAPDKTEYENQQDIWVLTILAFHWSRIPMDHNRRPFAGHGCHIARKQLITVSGCEIVEASEHELNKVMRKCAVRISLLESTTCSSSRLATPLFGSPT